MARKHKTSTPANSKNKLGLSNLRTRLNFLEKENDKLIKQIESSRSKLTKLNESIREVSLIITERITPFSQKILTLDCQIHNLFHEILEKRKLGKQSRKEVESIYYGLQDHEIISQQDMFFDEMLEDEFDYDEEDLGEYEGVFQDEYDETLEDIDKLDRDELKKIRQIFLRLAENFHPDKVKDVSEKEYRTEIMKEINLAYQSGDLARLLAIEKQQDLDRSVNYNSYDDLTRHCAKAESENTFLKEQLAKLNQELEIMKNTPHGEIATAFQRVIKNGGDPMSEVIKEIEAYASMLKELRQFVLNFRDRRITIKEFLKGPEVMRNRPDVDRGALLDFLIHFQ